MKRIGLFLLLVAFAFSVHAQEKIIPVVIDGDEVSYLREEQKVVAAGNVVMKYNDLVLSCDEAVYDAASNTATIKGNVKIAGQTGTVTAESADYDFLTQTAQIHEIRMESLPQEENPALFGISRLGEKVGENEYVLRDGYVTTCDNINPHYRLTSKKITIYPGDRVVARNMVFKVGAVPIMYLPYFKQSLKDRSFPFEISPGKTKDWGPYVLTRWRYNIDEKNKGKMMFDWYERRGKGIGVTHKFESEKAGSGLVNLYYISDKQYMDPGATARDLPDQDRYRAQLSYFKRINERMNVRGEYHRLSDKDFRKDFFLREHEIDPVPDTYFLADYGFSNSSFTLLTQKRVNRFFEETEYLPKFEYNFFRQPFTEGSPVYFESNSFYSNTAKRFGEASASTDYEASRLHSHNILSFQKKFAWLFVNPFAGSYTTYYSRNKFGDKNVVRQAPEMGVNFSTKLYKTVDEDFSLFGQDVDVMRHVLTPSISYHYIHEPTISNTNIFQFDSDDDLQRKDSIILKLENKLQARNKERIWDFVYFAPWVEYTLKKEGRGSHLETINGDLEIYPIPGVSLLAESIYDSPAGAFRQVNLDVGITDPENDIYAVQFGHRYARKQSSQATLSWRYRLNPKLEFRNYLRYEFRTDDFKEQQYMIRRDLHCWYMDVGVNVDESKNMTFWLVFTLKDFPDLHFGFENTYEGAKEEY